MTSGNSAGGFSRRNLLRGGLGAAAVLGLGGGLSGCGSPISAGLVGSQLSPGTITFWNLFSGGDGGRMQTMEQVYEKAHGGASALQAATFAWGNPYYTKVSLATLGGAPPDVAISHLTRSSNLANADLIEPLSEETLSLVGLSGNDFSAKPWAAQKVDGTNYALPLDTHPFVLYYNTDVCQKAGLLNSDGSLKEIKGTDGWEAALTAAKKVTGAYGASVATVGDTATSWRWFQTLYSQHDGATPWLGEDGRTLTYDPDIALSTLTYIQSLTKKGLMPANTDYAGSQTLMFTGKAAFYLQGEWEITTAQSIAGLKFGMVEIPTLFDKAACQGDSHTFVLPKKKRTEAQLKLHLGFVKAMLTESLIWAQGGHIPAYQPVLDSQDYKNLKPQSNYAGAAEDVVYDAPAWYSGSGSNFETTVGAQIGLVQQGLATPAAALSAARAQLQIYAGTKNPL